MRVKTALAARVMKAVEEDNTIICTPEEAAKHGGVTLSHMEYLGLSKSDLKRLERVGLALRGYANPLNNWKKPSGYRVRWLLIAYTGAV